MTAATESYTIGLAALATSALSATNQGTENQLIYTEQGITLGAAGVSQVFTVRQDSDLSMSHAEGYPCLHLYVDGTVEVQERLNRVQDFVVPVTCSILYEAGDANTADVYAIWHGQLAKMCIEKHYRSMTHTVGGASVSVPIWLITFDDTRIQKERVEDNRFLYRTDLHFTMWYRTQRGA